MKKFEIVIRGANEEAVAHAVMVGVYGAIRKYKHTDVSVQAATVKECADKFVVSKKHFMSVNQEKAVQQKFWKHCQNTMQRDDQSGNLCMSSLFLE